MILQPDKENGDDGEDEDDKETEEDAVVAEPDNEREPVEGERDLPEKVSRSTTARWMRQLNIKYAYYKKGFYRDVHELPRVVEERRSYLELMEMNRLQTHSWVPKEIVDHLFHLQSDDDDEEAPQEVNEEESQKRKELSREVSYTNESGLSERRSFFDVDVLKNGSDRKQFFRGGGIVNSFGETYTQRETNTFGTRKLIDDETQDLYNFPTILPTNVRFDESVEDPVASYEFGYLDSSEKGDDGKTLRERFKDHKVGANRNGVVEFIAKRRMRFDAKTKSWVQDNFIRDMAGTVVQPPKDDEELEKRMRRLRNDGYSRDEKILKESDKDHARMFLPHHYAAYKNGTNIARMLEEGKEPSSDARSWPRVGNEKPAIWCDRCGPPCPCPEYLRSSICREKRIKDAQDFLKAKNAKTSSRLEGEDRVIYEMIRESIPPKSKVSDLKQPCIDCRFCHHYLPVLEIGNDEALIHQNLCTATTLTVDGQQPLRKKTDGSGMMVSAFVTEVERGFGLKILSEDELKGFNFFRRLKYGNDIEDLKELPGLKAFEIGAVKEGYFNQIEYQRQVHDVFDFFEYFYPSYQAVLETDNSGVHGA